MEDYLRPHRAALWCKARNLPVIENALQRELVRIAAALQRAIHAGEESIPHEVRVYYQALKYIASVAGAPEGRGWYGTGTATEDQAALTADQLKTAAAIDSRVLGLLISGCDDMTIFAEMSGDMPKFQWLMDTTTRKGLAELCRRFEGFYHYAQILEGLASGFASGEIEVPE